MSLQILHKGHQISVPMDQTGFTGNVQTDSALAVVTKMVGGKIAAINSSGVATLGDGAAANNLRPLGFIINDAAGYFFENKPAIASGMIAVALFPGAVFITDQINTSLTFNTGDLLYCDTGANVGLVTNVAPTGGVALGVALSTASSAAPSLTFCGL